jgi:hypothetical protein
MALNYFQFPVFSLQKLCTTAVLLIIILPALSFGDDDRLHPVIDLATTKIEIEKNFTGIDLKELKSKKKFYLNTLLSFDKKYTNLDAAQASLLNALLRYDDQRAKILIVIPKIIREYRIEDPLKQELTNNLATFEKIIQEFRPHIRTLQDYKPYDFQIGFTYIAMMTNIQSYSSIYDKLQKDKSNHQSLIGSYTLSLNSSYKDVEVAKIALENTALFFKIQKNIEAINTEIKLR